MHVSATNRLGGAHDGGGRGARQRRPLVCSRVANVTDGRRILHQWFTVLGVSQVDVDAVAESKGKAQVIRGSHNVPIACGREARALSYVHLQELRVFGLFFFVVHVLPTKALAFFSYRR